MASTTTSRLLGLPPELRNRIYEFVFEDSEVTIRAHRNGIPCCTYEPPSLGILMTCRQTYREATDIFYSVTTFYFTWRMALVEFLRSLPPRHARMVSTIRFDTIARLEVFKSTGTGIAVAAQYDVFTARTSLKAFACPIPASIQSNVADFSRSSGHAKWTSTPWMTFAELYVQFPSE
ncbi:hypothetical protein M409DRAFT_58114 [Zasmidium cellare ATCC 36951]|uniref:DUF7730 domain-containing protein n=1 Tax=Zasmidium cellare ATCC 36951 TaxID=1080233 RepID=A0A6A6CB69_ZASCE|nr:uncharacterized protein M409DRAFT_58114 [Zasmidium cellare ATCC 36951]KAF2162706.1 hypothetical protein M409DRAFT_58114 [Zasmidium cellare ATCC 36951]